MSFSASLSRGTARTVALSPFEVYRINSRWSPGSMFTFDDLAGRPESDRDLIRDAAPWDAAFLDHVTCWRLHGVPACITSETYDWHRWASRMPVIERWANAHGLHACRPGVLKSWWFPSACTLIEFTPMSLHQRSTKANQKA